MWLNLLRQPISWLLLTLAVTAGGWIWEYTAAAKAKAEVTTLQSDLKAAADKANEAARREQAKDNTITALTTELAAQSEASQQLQGQLDQLAATAATREGTIKRLKRENVELKMWADRPLPAAVVGLLQRLATTGAADYQAHLSRTGPLPAAASGSPQ